MRRWKRLREMCCKPSTDAIPWQCLSAWNSLSGHVTYCYCQQIRYGSKEVHTPSADPLWPSAEEAIMLGSSGL